MKEYKSVLPIRPVPTIKIIGQIRLIIPKVISPIVVRIGSLWFFGIVRLYSLFFSMIFI